MARFAQLALEVTGHAATREEIFEWAEKGLLKPRDVPRALQIAGTTPQLSEWRKFVHTLLLWVGVILVASGVIFFFAYNWQSMHRFVKFGLAQALLAVAVIAAWRLGMERNEGMGALMGAALLTGAVLALVGQTYQTGADTFELFAVWAALILPWVVFSRCAPLWLLWVGLLNVAAVLFFQTLRWGLFGLLFGYSGTLWTLFVLNVVALVVWEAGPAGGIQWLHRWGARLLSFT